MLQGRGSSSPGGTRPLSAWKDTLRHAPLTHIACLATACSHSWVGKLGILRLTLQNPLTSASAGTRASKEPTDGKEGSGRNCF